MPDNVDSWLADLRSPTPTAVDIAVHYARECGADDWSKPTRDSALAIAKLAVALDRSRKDVASTAYLAVERLHQLQPLLDAAYAGDVAAFARESRKLREART